MLSYQSGLMYVAATKSIVESCDAKLLKGGIQ
jgi:hypothetical protein